MFTFLTFILKVVCFLIASFAFLLEMPFRIISALFLIALIIIMTLTAPLSFWKQLDITNLAEWTFLCKNTIAKKVYNSYAKALGV